MTIRPTWHETWMNIAHVMAQRSYDPRLRVGAVIVSNDNTLMLSSGYNGNYSGGPNEPESLEPGQSGFLHAEVNALLRCDFNFPKKKVMYLTHSPCRMCAKMLVNAGISKLVYDTKYRETSGLDILHESLIEVIDLKSAILMARST